MRYTPYLDSIGVTFKETVPDHAVNVIDCALSIISSQLVRWGSYEGRKRKPCPEDPILLAGQPIGMYHCPVCGMMVMAARPHLSPEKYYDAELESYTIDHYEIEYGQPWPAGYEEEEEHVEH